MYVQSQKLFDKLKKLGVEANYIYVYSLKFLRNITSMEFCDLVNNTQCLYFFHGYESVIKQLLFDKYDKVKIYGYRDACSRGGLNNKFLDNGIDIDKICNELVRNVK